MLVLGCKCNLCFYDLAVNDPSAGAPRGRVGQISHSVVLGTFNVGDQGEGGVPDLTRVGTFSCCCI